MDSRTPEGRGTAKNTQLASKKNARLLEESRSSLISTVNNNALWCLPFPHSESRAIALRIFKDSILTELPKIYEFVPELGISLHKQWVAIVKKARFLYKEEKKCDKFRVGSPLSWQYCPQKSIVQTLFLRTGDVLFVQEDGLNAVFNFKARRAWPDHEQEEIERKQEWNSISPFWWCTRWWKLELHKNEYTVL